jgi:hypothetical protein
MRLLASVLLATTMLATVPALAQDSGGSSSRMDQDNRYLEIAGEMTPDARATLPMPYPMPYAVGSTQIIYPQTSQLPQPMPPVVMPAEPLPLTSR